MRATNYIRIHALPGGEQFMTQVKDAPMSTKERALICVAATIANVFIANIRLFSFFALIAILKNSDRGWAISSFASWVNVSYGGPIFAVATPSGGDVLLEILSSLLFASPFLVMSTAISIGMSFIKHKPFWAFLRPFLFLAYGCLYLIWYLIGHIPL